MVLVTDKKIYGPRDHVRVWVENRSAAPYVIHIAGASSSCRQDWSGSGLLVSPVQGAYASSAPPRNDLTPEPCLAVVVPARDIVILPKAKTEAGTIDLAALYPSAGGKPVAIGPGTYVISYSMPASDGMATSPMRVDITVR